MVAARAPQHTEDLARRRVVATLRALVSPAAPSTAPDAAALPLDSDVLLQGLNRLPLDLVVRAVTGRPLAQCPRSSCTRPLAIVDDAFFACSRCLLSGGTGAWLGGFFFDFDSDQVHRALCVTPGCCDGADPVR